MMKNSGFTLIETLVAIAILMIAITGPLTIANQALTAALGARNVMIATYLAQDGMESLKNIKDNKVAAGLVSNTPATIDSVFHTTVPNCVSPSKCTIPYIPLYMSSPANGDGVVSCSDGTINCILYKGDASPRYINGSPGVDPATPFSRYYNIQVTGTNEAIVTVIVDWNDGSIPNEIKLQELMTTVPR